MSQRQRIDVLIVTAAAGEDDAVREVTEGLLSGWAEVPAAQKPANYPFRIWRARYSTALGGVVDIALTRAGAMGVEASTAAAAALGQAYDVGCFAMSGVCAGRPGWVSLGDVIIADRVFRYDVGEIIDSGTGTPVFHGDLLTHPLRAAWRTAAESAIVPAGAPWLSARPVPRERQAEWLLTELNRGTDPRTCAERTEKCPDWTDVFRDLSGKGLLQISTDGAIQLTAEGRVAVHRFLAEHPDGPPEPPAFRVHVGPFATGSNLVRASSIWERLSTDGHQRLIRGLDMEASCIGFAAFVHEAPWIVAKGVMDFAEPGRTQGFRKFAARAAAEVLIAFLRTHLDGGSGPSILDPGTAAEAGDNTNPSSLLSAHSEVVDFVQSIRTAEYDSVTEWVHADEPLAIRAHVGPGGAGKTRLFIKVAADLRAVGWDAGFLPESVEEAQLDAILASSRPVFVIVDYAEARPTLHQLLARLVSRAASSSVVIRVALLARDISVWWDALRVSSPRLGVLLQARAPLAFQPLAADSGHRKQLFEAAATAFGRRLSRKPTANCPDLSEDRYNQPLYIQMAALLAIDGIASSSDTLLQNVIDHEIRYWRIRYLGVLEHDLLDAADFDLRVCRLIAAVTLRGGAATHDELARISGATNGPSESRFPNLFRFLGALYRSRTAPEPRAQYIGAVQPDLLGEGLVTRVLLDCQAPAEFLQSVARESSAEGVRNMIIVLGRVAARLGADTRATDWIRHLIEGHCRARARPALEAALSLAAETIDSTVGPALLSVLEREGSTQLARELEPIIPEQTVSLREVAEWVARCALGGEPTPASGADDEVLLEHAIRQHNWAVRLCGVGRAGESVHPFTVAATIFHGLHAREPAKYRIRLAVTESARAACYQALGELEDMLSSAERACGALASDEQAVAHEHASALAHAMMARRTALSLLGRHQEAFPVAHAAALLNQQLAAVEPQIYLPSAAAAFQGLSDSFAEMGMRGEALVVGQQAISIYRRLVSSDADAYLPQLAHALTNVCFHYSELRLNAENLAAASEATHIYRRLAARQPAAFTARLAAALNNVSTAHRRVGNQKAGLDAAIEAVHLRRMLVGHTYASRDELAMSLNTLATATNEAGDVGGAVALLKEAIRLRRALALENRNVALPVLALNLSNLGAILSMSDNFSAALPFAREAVALYEELASERRKKFLPLLYQATFNLIQSAEECGEADVAHLRDALGEIEAELRREYAIPPR